MGLAYASSLSFHLIQESTGEAYWRPVIFRQTEATYGPSPLDGGFGCGDGAGGRDTVYGFLPCISAAWRASHPGRPWSSTMRLRDRGRWLDRMTNLCIPIGILRFYSI